VAPSESGPHSETLSGCLDDMEPGMDSLNKSKQQSSLLRHEKGISLEARARGGHD
jgi:hypothetical protein